MDGEKVKYYSMETIRTLSGCYSLMIWDFSFSFREWDDIGDYIKIKW